MKLPASAGELGLRDEPQKAVETEHEKDEPEENPGRSDEFGLDVLHRMTPPCLSVGAT
jgi:hypothetical protein